MPKIAVVIVSYNVCKDLQDCLKSLSRVKYGGEVLTIIIDNASNDGTKELLEQVKSQKLKIILSSENIGYAGGNNLGTKEALKWGAEYILILNPDTTVDPNFLKYLVAAGEAHPTSGIIGPKIYFAPGYEYHRGYAASQRGKFLWWAGGEMDWNNVMTVHRGVDEVDAGQFDRPGETEVVAGTAMFVRQAVFAKIGLFDEKYFLYFEESDFCRRARAAGFTLWYEPKAVLWHRNARSSGVGSDLHDYYTTRNRLLFGMRYAPWRAKLALLRQAMNLYFHGRKWQKQGVADFFLARLGPGTFPL